MIMAEPLRQRFESETISPAAQTSFAPGVRAAYGVLYAAFIVAPIVAGVDKFLHLLVNWDQYLAPVIARLLPVSSHAFMLAVGVIEVVAGLIVVARPSIGGWIVALWLWGIIANLLLIPAYFDIALRDFGLSLGAIALARLARDFER
jgi:hypothetical protein